MDPKRLWRPGMEGRIDAVLASGTNPFAYWVSATTLRKVIREGPGSDALKRRLIGFLNRKVIKGKPLANCVALGQAMAEFAEKTDDEDLIPISRNISDLNQVPYVIANGKPVS